jgi:hypothetical protein
LRALHQRVEARACVTALGARKRTSRANCGVLAFAHAAAVSNDVLSEGKVVGHIFKSGPLGKPWFWGFAYGHHYDRTPTHGYVATREDAMAAFRRGWFRK